MELDTEDIVPAQLYKGSQSRVMGRDKEISTTVGIVNNVEI